jgi:predicted amidohydrolase
MFDVEQTLIKLQDLTADAAGRGAALVVFPEAFVSAYPKGLGFGARMGMRAPEGREEFRRYFDSAIDVPGPATEIIGKAARAGGPYLVAGVIERGGGTLYCTALFFGPDGFLLGKHRKLMPTASERLVWGQGDGSTLPVLDTAIGKLGAVICWENYMPLRAVSLSVPAPLGLPTRLRLHARKRSGHDLDPRRELHRRASGPGAGRAPVRGRGHPDGRPRHGRDRPGEVRLRRGRSLRSPGRVPVVRQ